MNKRVLISQGVTVCISPDMQELLELIDSSQSIKVNDVSNPQKKLLKQMFERNLLVRRRKNNEVSYSIRPGINWK